MLDLHNPISKAFRMTRDRFNSNDSQNIKLKLIGKRKTDVRTYNLPSESEVAALIVGDIGCSTDRDIIVERQSGMLQCNELMNFILLTLLCNTRCYFHMVRMDIEVIFR